MKFKNILEEVSSLGFETLDGKDTVFLNSLNRALRQIYSEMKITKSARIIAVKSTQRLVCASYTHTPGKSCSFKIKGMAYSFKASGSGEYRVIDESGEERSVFNSPYFEARGFISGEGEIIFSGEVAFTVIDICELDSIRSPDVMDIPLYSSVCEYPLEKYIPDFGSVLALPKGAGGEEISEATLDSDRLFLPAVWEGEVIISYIPYPELILGNSDEEEINIPNRYSHLLSLLTSAYLWLDDDAEKAEYYMQLYISEAGRIKRYTPTAVGGAPVNGNGWA